MRILVFSDSHSTLLHMRRAIQTWKPDALVHLGDYYDDAQAIAQEYPNLQMHQVPGNCDRYRCPPFAQEILCYPVCGVKLYMTHGHIHHVKESLYRLLLDAKKLGAQAVLYGHTHIPMCYQEEDGLWVLNPGSCGYGGSIGLIEAENGTILSCRTVRQEG